MTTENTPRAYSSPSNAKRALATVANKLPESIYITGHEVTKGTTEEGAVGHYLTVFLDNKQSDITEDVAKLLEHFTVKLEPTEPEKATANKPAKADKTPRAAKADHVNKSAVESPVKRVHAICTEMFAANPGTARKDVIARCVSEGIATHTAATQYARWKKAKG